ncbi:HK97 family phage prohead protease [Microbacterium resistens]|uniref:HK97 family phage prohead protease n=1 Tax=Microbacterium resistens TaxID=156977 RepID=A0ABY3RUJ7_9MICO|nr:HK97 family phage prohead protease [Microbacterium resistens]UGS26595.1 HK97 family phage prohead protease [Microbacterium resistens]
MTEHQTRELHIRAAVNEQDRTVTGVGVPYNETITVWGERERLAPGAVEADGAKLFARHDTPIGVVTAHENTEQGWIPTAKFSRTAAADEAYQLARDGVYDGLSIGFDVLQAHYERDDEGDVIVYDRVRVREVSLVPFPAYPSARVTGVRHAPTTNPGPQATTREDATMADENPTAEQQRSADDIRELREQVQDVTRSVAVLTQRGLDRSEPIQDTRSAGEWIRGLASGDEDMIREYNDMVERAYAGGTSADGIKDPQYVGDTIRLINAPDALSQIFATGTLPAKGLQLEYGELKSDTTDVDEQANEGDDLTTGQMKVGLKYAPIKTYGGTFGLTRQAIERTTNVNLLDIHHRGLALKAARRKAAVLRAHYAGVVATNAADPTRAIVVADQTKYTAWVGGIVDAAEIMLDLGLSLDALVVDKSIFKELSELSDNGGRPLMRISGTGVNTVGEIAPKALGGDLASVAVRVNLKQATPGAAFVNGEAIRQYASPITELSDEKISNLTKEFGLYYYAANATEIPGAILPVVASAPTPPAEG